MYENSAIRQRSLLYVAQTVERYDALLSKLESDPCFLLTQAATAETGLKLALKAKLPFDAVLIHVDLPDMDGRSKCAHLRASGVNTPVLLMSDHENETEVVSALDSGANDYIKAPFRPAEVKARIHTHIRTYEQREDAILVMGPLMFRQDRRELQHSETYVRVSLTDKESAVLKLLCLASAPVSRHTLMQKVWGYKPDVVSRTLETHIYSLRRKIRSQSPCVTLVNKTGAYQLRIQPDGE